MRNAEWRGHRPPAGTSNPYSAIRIPHVRGPMTPQPTILVIDDEQGILETLRILLKNEGFEVTTAQGGKAGLEALRAGVPDIVLTDVKMPGVTGIEILTAAREHDPQTPVILMTA